MSSDRISILQFSKISQPNSTPKRQRKIHGVATSSKPLPPLIARCEEDRIRERLALRLRQLDVEQIQIVEIVTIAIARGRL